MCYFFSLVQDVISSFDGTKKLRTILQENDPLLVGKLTYSKYLWAWNTINTRAVYMKQEPHSNINQKEGDTLALAPVLDYLNHSFNAEVCNSSLFVCFLLVIYFCYFFLSFYVAIRD